MVRTMRIQVANSSINSDKTRLELDTHNDTTVIGKVFFVVHDFDRPIIFTEYDPEDGRKVLGMLQVSWFMTTLRLLSPIRCSSIKIYT